jgi:hypothetical protein
MTEVPSFRAHVAVNSHTRQTLAHTLVTARNNSKRPTVFLSTESEYPRGPSLNYILERIQYTTQILTPLTFSENV